MFPCLTAEVLKNIPIFIGFAAVVVASHEIRCDGSMNRLGGSLQWGISHDGLQYKAMVIHDLQDLG